MWLSARGSQSIFPDSRNEIYTFVVPRQKYAKHVAAAFRVVRKFTKETRLFMVNREKVSRKSTFL